LITRYKQNINNSSVKIDLAEKYILMNLPDSARLLLDNIYSYQKKKHQLDFSVSFNLSQLYYKIRSLDRSIEILDQIVDSGVDSSDIAYFFRLLYKSKRSSDIDALLEYAELSENIDRKQKSYWQIIRILKKYKREPDLEAELYLKVIDLYTSDYKYLPSLLNSFSWRMTELEKNLDIALVKINKALEYGEDIKILDTKAEVLWKLNRSEEAVEIIEKCILSDPQNKYYKDQKKKFLSAST
jgi:tetratricopeptide (TPR) repeat protein